MIPKDRRFADQRQAQPEPPGTATRRAALKLLDAVLRRGLPLEAALGAVGGLPKLEDRQFARAIASEVLRHLPDLDGLIDTATTKALPDDAKARFALRIALVQTLVMGTPAHAAIATALPLVDGGPRRLVHGVFGTLSRQGASLPDPPHFPVQVAERWSVWGADAVNRARAGLQGRPPLDLTVKDTAATGEWMERLGASSLMPGHLRLAATEVTDLAGYEEGAWWVQDLSASLPARCLGAGIGHALDLCASPGGKTLQLAAAGWQVTAVEMASNRLTRLSDNLVRTRLVADLVEADVLDWQPAEPVDAILLDAPCSASGIFRRHPDVLHRVRAPVVRELAETQKAMLARAANWLRPGGRLVYAVCSLEIEEGEHVAATCDLKIDPICQDELPEGLFPSAEGWVRVPPGALTAAGGCDGFFVARFVKA